MPRVTGRAAGDINIDSIQTTVGKTTVGSGNLNIETMFSQNGSVILSAQGSIVAALDNGFTTIRRPRTWC